MISLFALITGIYLLLALGDRLWRIDWVTVKPLFMVMYLTHAFWVVGILGEAVRGEVQWYQGCALIAMVCWVRITAPNWRKGVPDLMKTGSGALGPPEIEQWTRQ